MILPKTISRYIILELAKVFIVTLTALVVVLVLVGVVQESLRRGLTPAVTFQLVPFVLLNALCFAVPGTLLFSACSVYGRMAAANELTALKSAGVSPVAALRPVIVVALFFSLGTVWLIDVAFSWGHAEVQRVIASSVEEIACAVLSKQKHFRSDRFSIHVQGIDGRRLLDPTIVVYGGTDGHATTIMAREAMMEFDPQTGDLRFKLSDGLIEVQDQATLHFTDSIEHVINIGGGALNYHQTHNPSHMRLANIPSARREQYSQLDQTKELMAAEAAFQMLTGDFDSLADAAWNARLLEIEHHQQRLHRLETEPYRRWASGFSCFSFVLIGAPLAIRLRTADLFTSFGICFLPILLIYYPLFALGLDRAKSGEFPPYSVWLANGVCLCLGVSLLQKVLKH